MFPGVLAAQSRTVTRRRNGTFLGINHESSISPASKSKVSRPTFWTLQLFSFTRIESPSCAIAWNQSVLAEHLDEQDVVDRPRRLRASGAAEEDFLAWRENEQVRRVLAEGEDFVGDAGYVRTSPALHAR